MDREIKRQLLEELMEVMDQRMGSRLKKEPVPTESPMLEAEGYEKDDPMLSKEDVPEEMCDTEDTDDYPEISNEELSIKMSSSDDTLMDELQQLLKSRGVKKLG